MVCNKCQIDKEMSEYATYIHSSQNNKLRTRKLCKSCFNHQKSVYRERIRKEKIIQPDPVKITPTPNPVFDQYNGGKRGRKLLDKTELFIGMESKVCYTCKEKKEPTEFYTHNSTGKLFSSCIVCELDKDRRKYLEYLEESAGGTKTKNKPGEYNNIWQQENVEGFLKVLGWKHNGTHWYKEGVRSGEDGVWERMRGMKRYRAPLRTPKKSPVMDRLRSHIEDIIELRNEGMSLSKIGYIYKTSGPYITKVINEYYEKK